VLGFLIEQDRDIAEKSGETSSKNQEYHAIRRKEDARPSLEEGMLKLVESRSIMLNLAADYDKLEARSQERPKTTKPAPSPDRE
jgi:hypothetical protein